MTLDEACVVMAEKGPVKSPDQWRDYFEMSSELQVVEAQLIKTAIFESPNPSMLQEIVAFAGVALTIITDAAGFASGYTALKALL